jgi:hypothetical protein
MWVAVCVLMGLVPPLTHQLIGHNLHRRALRLVWAGTSVPVTMHERKHAARPTHLRLAADAAWVAWMAGWITAALAVG